MRELRKAPPAEAKEEPGLRSGKRMTAQAVALAADYILLRLPHEVEGLFSDWLDAHLPD